MGRLVAAGAHVGIIGRNQVTSDMPGHTHLKMAKGEPLSRAVTDASPHPPILAREITCTLHASMCDSHDREHLHLHMHPNKIQSAHALEWWVQEGETWIPQRVGWEGQSIARSVSVFLRPPPQPR